MSNNDFLLAVVLCAMILFMLCLTMARANARFAPLSKTEVAIPEFSTNVVWDPYPRVVNIENAYDCNAKSLRKCDISDPTTLFGCRELTARCHHFDRDVTLRDEAGVESVIPKNSSANEGYAMAITDLAKACNPYHGDFVLVTQDSDNDEYMLICSCKNPGYIGNEHLLDNCESVFICDGKVDDVNQPLDQLNCICPINEHSVRYETGLSACKPLLVHEANKKYPNGWTNLVPFIHSRQLPLRAFNATVRDNLKVDSLLDPCRSSLNDMSIEIPNGRYDSFLKSCAVSETGYPVELGTLDGPRAPEKRVIPGLPSGRESETIAGIGAVLATGLYEFIRFTDQIAGKRKLGVVKAPMTFNNGESSSVLLRLPENIGVGEWSQIYIETPDRFVGGRCEGNWPNYNCYMYEYFSYKNHGIPLSGKRDPPGTFLWGTENWVNSEGLAQASVLPNITGVLIKQDQLTKLDAPMLYGLYLTTARTGKFSGLLGFKNWDDYHRVHLNSITPD